MADTEKKPASTVEWLIAQIDAFLAKNPHITKEVFGWRAVKQVRLVDRLKAGGDTTTRKLDRIIAYMGDPNSSNPHHNKGVPNGQESQD